MTAMLSKSVIQGWFESILNWLYAFFNPKLSGYTNFDFGTGEMVNIRIMIFGIFGGVMLAALYTIYIKNIIGAFVRKLLQEQCFSPENARTLSELGFLHNPFVRSALRGSVLASTVVSLPPSEEQVACEGDIPRKKSATEMRRSRANATRYYIKEEKKYVAEMRFNARGSGWPTFFFVLLISIICIFLIFAFLPQILRFLDNTISIFSVEGNTIK